MTEILPASRRYPRWPSGIDEIVVEGYEDITLTPSSRYSISGSELEKVVVERFPSIPGPSTARRPGFRERLRNLIP
jgi:hypothetical protein